jgi:hypothetical protein
VLLQLLVDEIVLLATASADGAAVDALFLGDGRGLFHVIVGRAMKLFLEDGVGVHGFELGLEVTESLGAAIGTAALVGKVVAVVLRLLALDAPTGVSAYGSEMFAVISYQLPLPPPCFFTPLGSASTNPDLAK